MGAVAILGYVATAIQLAQQAYQVGKDIAPILSKVYKVATGGENATQADIDALIAASDELSAELQAPLPDNASEKGGVG